ncbi:hypothetical protein J8273_8318 [Carpediemonas membranifera]|uniref:Uncharacterized protein n=1 Tax=Carpediemonas membranifera TaxID=201153 RepID=A0A8J6DZ58_9EUKA|nr:hypothetical protein J8273_8318 [Carpediemonas membranifera]|eukprot:KAG9390278.1 hypothetical protein J8273_8318 [Carpediemonas membranifera]
MRFFDRLSGGTKKVMNLSSIKPTSAMALRQREHPSMYNAIIQTAMGHIVFVSKGFHEIGGGDKNDELAKVGPQLPRGYVHIPNRAPSMIARPRRDSNQVHVVLKGSSTQFNMSSTSEAVNKAEEEIDRLQAALKTNKRRRSVVRETLEIDDSIETDAPLVPAGMAAPEPPVMPMVPLGEPDVEVGVEEEPDPVYMKKFVSFTTMSGLAPIAEESEVDTFTDLSAM